MQRSYGGGGGGGDDEDVDFLSQGDDGDVSYLGSSGGGAPPGRGASPPPGATTWQEVRRAPRPRLRGAGPLARMPLPRGAALRAHLCAAHPHAPRSTAASSRRARSR